MKRETTDLLGEKVGHIRVVDVLGEGGMGAVYVGFDDTLQRKVALKAIRSEFRLSEEAKARFLREARILSQVDHPHICRVFDYVEGEEDDFLVLELIEGKNLRQVLEKGLEKKQAIDIARQILDVLVTVHGQGVIHRDLKPENVMIMENGDVKVLDFGLARSVDEEAALGSGFPTIASGELPSDLETGATRSSSPDSRSVYVKTRLGTVIGTVGYMSPEQARGELAMAASDMYSLGLILQEMLTGQPPFEHGLEAKELVTKAAKGETLPTIGLSADLTTFIGRLQALAPGARPSSVDALAQLKRVIDRPKRLRRRILVTAIWLILVLLSGSLAFQSIRATRGEKRAEREAEAANEVSDFLIGLFEQSDPSEALGNTITAREILDKGSERIEHELADQPLVQARMMDTMGVVYKALGLYEQATPLLEAALLLRREHLPADHFDVADSLNNLASQLWNKGDNDAAEPLFREALTMRRRLLGDEHPHVARCLNSLAALLRDQGDHDVAEPLFREALAILEKTLPPNHPQLQKALGRYASLLRSMGRDAEAEEFEARARAGDPSP